MATVLDLRVLASGVLWLAFGILLYVVYRRRQGLSLTETHKIVMPKPVVEHEVEYQSVLVAFEDGNYSPEAVATAARLAARRRRGIHVLVTITVPANSPIDASMPEQEQKAASIIDSARVQRRAARDRPLGEGAPGPGGPPHRRGGAGDQGAGDRDVAAAAAHRRLAVRPRRSRRCSASGPAA